jgi:hypothetical protein
MQGLFYALRQITNNYDMKRKFSAKQVSRIAICLDLGRPLDVYDLRKSMFGRLTAIEKSLPLHCFQVSRAGCDETESRNREILDRLELSFDSEILLDERSMKNEIQATIDDLEEVVKCEPERKDQA